MKNVDFLKEVLMSNAEYWIVAKEVKVNRGFRSERERDHIMFISIPKDIKRGLKYEEITLQELEKLNRSYCEQNIYINTDYPPFQLYGTFSDIYIGFPVTHKIREFIINSLALGSDAIWEYKQLIQVPDAVDGSE